MLHVWDNFFVTTAQAGAALIGLLFVTVTVGTGFSTTHMLKGTRAFLTPTLLHFVGVLFLSLAMLAPWGSLVPLGVVLGVLGLSGLIYQILVIRDRRESRLVKMGWGEWIPYTVVPALSNAALAGGGFELCVSSPFALPLVAGGTVALLASGVLGAWDMTLWLVRNHKGQ